MNSLTKKCLLLSACVITCKTPLLAQEGQRLNYIGINPSVTVEPFYNKGELDINIFPLVYQRTLTKRSDLRLTSILNLGLRNSANEISHFGFETAFPIFLRLKETKSEISKGLFIAPILSIARNRSEGHNNLGLWIEPGYNLLFEKNFAMTFGLQLGGTYFSYDHGQTKWGNHFGIKIIFGKWL
ncbi:MAG: hypothetical protein ACK417_11555 [Bacteroidia bacterium]